MSTKQCPECRAEIPGDAKRCMHCGHHPGRAYWYRQAWLSAVILGVALLVVVYLATGPH